MQMENKNKITSEQTATQRNPDPDPIPIRFGKPFQVAAVVRDLEGTMAFLEKTFGLGPWASFHDKIVNCTVKGIETEVRIKAGIWFSGDIQLELIQVVSGETLHEEYFGGKKQGLHHLAFESVDYDEALISLTTRNIPLLQKGTDIPSVPLPLRLEHAYFQIEGCGGLVLEIAKARLLNSFDVPLRVGQGRLLQVQSRIRKSLCWIPAMRVWKDEAYNDQFTAKDRGLQLGRIVQVGMVVQDLDRTIRCLDGSLGIGPWVYAEGEGRTAIAVLGKVQLELNPLPPERAEPRADPENRSEGLRYIGFVVQDIHSRAEMYRRNGVSVYGRGSDAFPGFTTEYVFLDVQEKCGFDIKLLQYTSMDVKRQGASLYP